MFISKSEKEYIESRLAQLESALSQISALQGNVILLEKAIIELQQGKKDKVTTSSAKEAYKRAKSREYARRYYAKKKEAKQLQVVTGTQA